MLRLPSFSIGERIRNRLFWGLDSFSGSSIRRNFLECESLFNSPHKCSESQNRQLKLILEHALRYTPFYADYRGSKKLDEFPVINKHILKDNYHLFFSKAISKKKMHPVATSGSEGMPIVFYHDKQKRLRKTADLIFFNRKSGIYVGHKHLLIRTRGKSRAALILQNEKLIVASRRQEITMESYRRKLRDKSIRAVIGHPSIMRAIADYATSMNDTPNMYSFHTYLSTSEPIFENDRNYISETFGCNILARYSSEELGIIGHEIPGDRRYHLNSASLYIELLSFDSDDPVPPGVPGRIVITDIYSFGMPLIRYDIGDIAVMSPLPSLINGGKVFENVEGRKTDIIYDVDGNRIFPLMIYDCITKQLSANRYITAYQFVQKDRTEYLLRLQAESDSVIPEKQIKMLQDTLMKRLGKSAHISICTVPKVFYRKSGKQPFIINEYKN
jgi:phenylacetate-CoA ligase